MTDFDVIREALDWCEGDCTPADCCNPAVAALSRVETELAETRGQRDEWENNFATAYERAEAAEARVTELEAERNHYKASYRRSMLVDPALCCVGSQSGPNREMLLCGFEYGHEGDHSWATLPTFPLAAPTKEDTDE